MHCEGLLPGKWSADLQDRLLSNLEKNPSLQLGEVGLDRRFKDVIPLDRQAEILRTMLRFALNNEKSVSIHCVQATAVMLDILKKITFGPYRILWHGFTGSKETAAVLSRLKVIVSIGPRFSGNLGEIFEANPAVVPETDYEGTDGAVHTRILEGQYARFSKELRMSPDSLLEHTDRLFRAFSPNPGY